jgi:flavin reductase (DIM6/NTAB) family NADH-FMN oxidoreductase RutF
VVLNEGQAAFVHALRAVLEGAAAVFECANRSQYEEGDHVIFVGEVELCSARAGATPLIFHGGRYFTELPIG